MACLTRSRARVSGILLLTGVACLACLSPSSAHAAEVRGLATGKFLVARRDLPDPNFAETVILLAQYDEQGAVGLVINQPTRIRLSRLFQDLDLGERRADPVYRGGPVAITGVLALMRSQTEPKDARKVSQSVYLVNSVTGLEEHVQRRAEPNTFRVYLGYAGWGAGQLDREVDLGSWHIFDSEPGLVFDPEPDSLWERLIRRSSMVLVQLFRFPPPELLRPRLGDS